jgi:hypothetical protein
MAAQVPAAPNPTTTTSADSVKFVDSTVLIAQLPSSSFSARGL